MPERAPLDFVVIGAQKAATSWLYLCLRDHPGIHVPPSKLEREYLGGSEHAEKGTEWFLRQLGTPEPGQVVGDVSVQYQGNPRSPAAVAAIAPAARVVLLAREPVDRALSAHAWLLRRGLTSEHDPVAALRHALADEAAGRDTPFVDLLTRGDYHLHLARWIDQFGPEAIYVERYDRVAQDPAGVIEGIYAFLGVDPSVRPASLGERPKQNARSKVLLAAERMAPRARVVRWAMNRLNQVAARVAGPAPPPPLPADLRAALDARFRDGRARLDALLEGVPASQRPARPFAEAWASQS